MEIKHKILSILLRVDAGTTTPLDATREISLLFDVSEKKVGQIENKKNNEPFIKITIKEKTLFLCYQHYEMINGMKQINLKKNWDLLITWKG